MRDIIWSELQQFDIQYSIPWLLAGDFNETISVDERMHGRPEMLRRCTRVKHRIENNGLIDVGFLGRNPLR